LPGEVAPLYAASPGFLPLTVDPDRSVLLQPARVPAESSLQPSPEQAAIIAARRADPGGSLRVVAFAGSGKTTALRLLAEAESTPALYLAYNKSTRGKSPGSQAGAERSLTRSGR
jgi:hypothetical protein